MPTSDEEHTSTSTSPTSVVASSLKSFASTDAPALCAVDLRKGRRLRGVSFSVNDSETLVVLGASGAGKTSLLRVIAGLEDADSGTAQLDGADLLALPPQRRRIAMVFQDDALFPHMSIYENLAFALRLKGTGAREIDRRVRSAAQALTIEAHLGRRPARLSGGERQRASLARAVLGDPRVLLLDEPLAHLDPQLRARVRRQFIEFGRTFPGAAIHVTHDHIEALTSANRLAILMDGRIAQLGDPREVYDSPANTAIARFFGSPPMNLLEDTMETIGIRPEHVRITDAGKLAGRVISREYTGPDLLLTVRTLRGDVVARVSAQRGVPADGSETGLAWDDRFVRRFDRSTGVLLA